MARSRRRFFLSHSHADRDLVRRVASDLASSGHPVWLDFWELKPGDSIISKINDALSTSGFLIVFLSPTSLKSRWVTTEVNAALINELSLNSITVVVALLEGCSVSDVPPLLQDKVWVDFRSDYLTGICDLLELFRRNKKASDLLFRRATQLLQFQRVDEAIDILERAVGRYRANYDAWYNLGVAYQAKGRLADSTAAFNMVLGGRKDDPWSIVAVGLNTISDGHANEGLLPVPAGLLAAPNPRHATLRPDRSGNVTATPEPQPGG